MPNIATKWILFGGAFIIATAGKSKELEINGQIRDREVRLIGADGEQKGVVSIQVAMRAAEDAGLDLVKIAPQAVPPVCKVLDYGKYRFEQQKKETKRKNANSLTTANCISIIFVKRSMIPFMQPVMNWTRRMPCSNRLISVKHSDFRDVSTICSGTCLLS